MGAVNTLIKFLLIVLILGVMVVAGTILKNRPPLLDAPGPLARVGIYVTSNTVETRQNAIRPELRPRIYDASPEQARESAQTVMEKMGWDIIHVDADSHSIQAVAMTPLLRFQDDIYVRLHPVDSDLSSLYFRSRSRVGRADLAANTRHFLEFRDRLETELMR